MVEHRRSVLAIERSGPSISEAAGQLVAASTLRDHHTDRNGSLPCCMQNSETLAKPVVAAQLPAAGTAESQLLNQSPVQDAQSAVLPGSAELAELEVGACSPCPAPPTNPSTTSTKKPKSWWEFIFGSEDDDDDPIATTWRCVGDPHNRSCYFRNLYYLDGNFVMLVTWDKRVNSIDVRRANKYEGSWRPKVERFSDKGRMKDWLEKKLVIEEKGLSLYFHPLFHHNIGHAIFDGLYPAFLALVKLGLHDRPFRPVVSASPDCFDDSANGSLNPGDAVETYIQSSDYASGRSLHTVHAEIIRVEQEHSRDVACRFRNGYDHSGLSLGLHGSVDSKEECCRHCANTFSCQAGVLFGGTCFLKGKCYKSKCAYPSDERVLCSLPPSHGKVPEIKLKLLHKQGEEPQANISVPADWVVGKVRRRCKAEGIYEAFGQMGEIRRLFEMERDAQAHKKPKLVLHFKELAVGNGGAGNLVADQSGAIAGSLPPLNAMALFRDRMLRSYGLPVLGEGSDSEPTAERAAAPVQRRINMIIVQNKRFNGPDIEEIQNAIQQVSNGETVSAELISWDNIGGPFKSFKEHLKKVQESDVYVSSIGTALQYVPFMRDGGIFVALGSIWQRSKQLFPTFMESQLAGGGTPYLRTLYADPGARLRMKQSDSLDLGQDGYMVSVNGTLLAELLSKAESLLRTGFRIPVPPYENLGVEGRILLELCSEDPDSCREMNELRNNHYECAVLLWPECIVYEVGPWRASCGVNRKLLRDLRRKHGIPGYGAPES